MASREHLNKLSVAVLRSLAAEYGVDVLKKKKADLINDLISCKAPVSVLTPVVNRSTDEISIQTPVSREESLPPFNQVTYVKDAQYPVVTFSDIYDFMVARRRDSGECVSNFKGLDRAVKHFSAGDVNVIGTAKVTDKVIYIKGTCQASMKKHVYDVYVCLSSTGASSASIDYGYCQCPVGLAQTCSHMGSMLFALSNATSATTDTCSSTSRLCEWNIPRHSVKPKPMSELKTGKPTLMPASMDPVQTDDSSALPCMSAFDPRHTSTRGNDVERTLKHLTDLKAVFPNTGIYQQNNSNNNRLAHLWNIPDTAPDASIEMEVSSTIDPMFLEMEKMLFTNACKENLPSLSISAELVSFIEHHTRDQRVSQMWKDLHIGRLTSSIFGDVLSAGDNPKSLVKRILNGSNLDSYDALPPAVQWGIDCESKAREQYTHLQKMVNPNITFEVENTGLTLCETHSFLGASSDGRVIEGDRSGVLEVKCPYSVKGIKVNQMEVQDIVALNINDFCLECVEEEVQLRRKHKYYSQVQGEMAIMSLPFCDFVVWTGAQKNNIFVERINFDIDYVNAMMPKLVEFYIKHISPVFYQ
ncbi:uncharacterized protein [Argopecten irradians]|uniref:uncharacterized protein isoform X1 n=1 Tax=Argopecten irradians TaxID=31199 RepID=UPI00371D9398